MEQSGCEPERSGRGRDGAVVVSVNVGLPATIEWRGRTLSSGIFKRAVEGRVRARFSNLEGDGQADLSVHGGVEKAVYGYPSEHYDFWCERLGVTRLPWGAFGENLTTEGLAEERVHIGDRFRVGSVELVVTQPRLPCAKLAVRLDRQRIVAEFTESGRSGFYFSVAREGELGAGDRIELLVRDERRLTVCDVAGLASGRSWNAAMLRRAAQHPGLPQSWRDRFGRGLKDSENGAP